MRTVKWVVIALLGYVAIVAAFETLIGTVQPSNEQTIRITTFEPDGTAHDRVVSKLESNGQLYVAANHWPRAWYTRVLENPKIQVAVNGEKRDYRAVSVSGEEHERVDTEHALPFVFRVLTGFPPRYFVRLDPAAPAPAS
jgi:hypothetical protein